MSDGERRELQGVEPEPLPWEMVDESALKAQLEATKMQWYYVSGALDFVQNKHQQIEQIFAQFKTDPEQLKGVLAITAESHMMRFTPSIWKEAIRVVAGTNYEAGPIVAEYLIQTLVPKQE